MNLVLIRGLPGSGKSTLAKDFLGLGYNHYEADMFFMDSGIYNFDISKLKQAHEFCFEETRKSLYDGFNTVVSNTFTTLWEMQKYIDLAEKEGYNLYIVKATGKYKDIHGCPKETVERMSKRWEGV